jgi:hypothetical protein
VTLFSMVAWLALSLIQNEWIGLHASAWLQVPENTVFVLLLSIIVLLLVALVGFVGWVMHSSLNLTRPQATPAPSRAPARRSSHRSTASPDRAGFVRSVIEDTPTPPPMPYQVVAPSRRTPPIAPRIQHAAQLIDRRDPRRRYDVWNAMDIGRSASNPVQVLDALVSRHHACLRLEQDRFCLFDLSSANGTFVNNQRVNGARVLYDGDILTLGETEFVFRQLA